jgi:predicted phage terminase large subunit-like protein
LQLLLSCLSEREKRQLDALISPVIGRMNGYETWLKQHFAAIVSKPLSSAHRVVWEWVEALRPDVRPLAQFVILARGAGKSTTVELATARVGAKLARRYVLYVSETQDQADKHVAAIASLLEKLGIERSLSKYGHSKGWKRNQLRAMNGFNVEALGLDTAARGIKLDEFRPDLIVLDDIDNQNDTPRATEKKVRTLTTAILPAGSTDCAILGVQNLILDGGVFSQIQDGSADFLRRRAPVIMQPAIDELEYEAYVDEDSAQTLYRITGGTPTWEGQGIEVCEAQINDWGLAAFLREAQHQVQGADGYFFDHKSFRIHDEMPADLDGFKFCRAWDLAATQGGGDYTVGALHAWSPSSVEYVVDVERDQLSSDNVRKLMLATARADAERFGAVTYRIPNDPGQAGNYQSDQLAAMLREVRGITVKVVSPSGRKSVRARGWADQVNNGNAVLIRGEWNWHFKEEHRKFREDEQHEHDDQCDAASDAHNELAPGGIQAPAWQVF